MKEDVLNKLDERGCPKQTEWMNPESKWHMNTQLENLKSGIKSMCNSEIG